MVKDAQGNVAFGTPRIGTPVLNVSVKDITIEIDALGTQLYDDVASDPQQNNIITLSINDCELNANYYKKWYEEGLYTDAEYKTRATFVVGSAKSVTTRTEISTTKGDYKDAAEYGYSSTVKSVSVGATEEILSMLPSSAHLYLNFHISEQQPAEAYDEAYQDKFLSLDSSDQSTLLTESMTLLTDNDKPSPKPSAVSSSSGLSTGAIIAIAAGAVVVVVVIIVIAVVAGKKKKSGGDANKNESENPKIIKIHRNVIDKNYPHRLNYAGNYLFIDERIWFFS